MGREGVNHSRRAALLWSLIAALVAALAVVPVRAQEPTVSPTPTPSPADAALARAFAVDGEIDAAVGAYRAVVEQGTASERLAARLALAQLYLDGGQPATAERELDAYLIEAPLGADVRGAQFLLAESLVEQGRDEDALPLYDVYIAGGGGASVYARLARAGALARLGRGAEATLEGESLLREELPAGTRLALMRSLAQALEESDPQDAIAWYGRLRDESASPSDQALALWRSAVLGGDALLYGVWQTVLQRYPETATAQAIVDDPPPSPPGVDYPALDPYYPGLVYYRAGRSTEARREFEASIAATGTGASSASFAARSSYYLAIMDENAGRTEDALVGYARVIELDGKVELADDALWWRGRLLEQTGAVAEARTQYERLAEDYAGSEWAPEARFRLALLDYDAGAYEKAADAFAALVAGSEDEARERALLWEGKAFEAADDALRAEAAWRALQREAPDGFYGLRAGVLLGFAEGRSSEADLGDAPAPDWSALEAWLRDRAGVEPSDGLETLLYDGHWGLGQELLALGMERRAGDELALLLEDAADDPAALYQLARYFSTRGVTDLSARAATRLLNALPDGVRAQAPDDLFRLAYPAAFASVVTEVADAHDVPDLLLLSMVRQESFFDPLAGSSAGALGLTQVIPATGRAIAKALAIEDFDVEHLFRPVVSLEFGAHYLREQLDTLDGNLYYALAAYNAGPGNALRWRDAAGDDIDRFVAEIDYAQTEAYVTLVGENLARYRQLYQGLDGPSLPQD